VDFKTFPKTSGMEYNVLTSFACGESHFEGFLELGTKLFLKDAGGQPVMETFIPLEQIEFMKIRGNVLEIRVFPSAVTSFTAFISARRRGFVKRLAADIAQKAGMGKRFFLNEWYGEVYNR